MSAARLDDQLCFALYSASGKLANIYRTLLDPVGLTYTQFIVLMALWEEDEIAITVLARKANLSKGTMTPLLKRLENNGLIKRCILPDNERQKSIKLTTKGQELSKLSLDITQKAFCETGLNKAQAETLISLCHQLVENQEK